jgi:hypothetical protein
VGNSVTITEVDWYVSYHGDLERERHKETLVKIGVSDEKIHLFRLPEMVRKVPELFEEV